MQILLVWFVGALLVALIARFCGRHFATVTALSTGGGMVIAQLWAKWAQNNVTSFRDLKAVLVIYALGGGIAAAAATIAHVVHRLIRGSDLAAQTVAPAVTGGRTLRKRTTSQAAPSRQGPLSHSVGSVLIALVTLVLAGPYLALGQMGSAPLATIDGLMCALVLAILVCWLIAFSFRWWLVAVSLGVLASCLSVLPLISGPQVIMNEPVTLTGAWLVGLLSIALAVCPLVAQREAHLQQPPTPGSLRTVRIVAAVFIPLVLLAIGFLGLVALSDKARAAMHPTPRVAVADWAELIWKDDRRSSQKEDLEAILRTRAQWSPRWWSKAFPELLADANPAIRYAAIELHAGSSPRVVWSDEVMHSLLTDTEPKVRSRALHLALFHKPTVPDDAVLSGAVAAGFAPTSAGSNRVSPADLEKWVGHERMVRVMAEMMMRLDGRAHESLTYEVWLANDGTEYHGTLTPEILALVVADPQSQRQAGCLDLLMRDFPYNYPWRPSKQICDGIDRLATQAGDLGKKAAVCRDSLRRRGCCQPQ